METSQREGQNLIFVISQPRAGSTLLQKILATQPDVLTLAEPWIALHPLFALREKGIRVGFDPRLVPQAVQEFVRHIPEGEEAYWEGTRRMLSHLYDRALSSSGRSRFLDKTPRYYFIIPELQRVFPKASFVFLLRNPLAVLSSILDSWVKSTDVERLGHFRYDLMAAPRLILEGIRRAGPNAIVVRYEDLTSTPESCVRRLCESLGLAFSPSMIDYGLIPANRERWLYGDQGTVYNEDRPVVERAGRWREVLKQSSVWKSWAKNYLNALGRDLVQELGYDYDQFSSELASWSCDNDPASGSDGTAFLWKDPGVLDEIAEVRRLLADRTVELERTAESFRTSNSQLVEARHLLTERTLALETAAQDLRTRTDELVQTRDILAERTALLERATQDLQMRTEELVDARRLLAERTQLLERAAQAVEATAGSAHAVLD